jgi:putative tryptophan/tyrosine transport system substrate-binding protein
MASYIGRRKFLAALGGAAAAWPLAARAQQAGIPVIGLINAGGPETSAYRIPAFRQGLNEAGLVEGQNVALEYRWAEGRYDLMPDLVADLLRRQVAVIATPGSTAAALAAKAATTTIPIVFGIGEDPIKLGLVASLAKPGSNATGINFFTTELTAKRLELLREMVPGAARLGVLVNRTNAVNAETTLREVEAASRAIGLPIRVLNASNRPEIDSAFATVVREKVDALFVGPDGFFNSRRVQLVLLAARHMIPATYSLRDYPEIGGLMSYGTSFPDVYRQVGFYTGRVLKGAQPAELPVIQPTKFELVINSQAANLLGLAVPPTLLARADEVIE